MSQSIIISDLQHHSPTGPSRFKHLPAEIRCRIYYHLFPDLHCPFKIDLYANYIKESRDDASSDRTIRKTEDGILLTVRLFCGSDERIRPQLESAMSMTAICSTIRTEVVRTVYSNLILAWTSEGSLMEFTNSLTPTHSPANPPCQSAALRLCPATRLQNQYLHSHRQTHRTTRSLGENAASGRSSNKGYSMDALPPSMAQTTTCNFSTADPQPLFQGSVQER